MKAVYEMDMPKTCIHCILSEVNKFGHTVCAVTGQQGSQFERASLCPLKKVYLDGRIMYYYKEDSDSNGSMGNV